MLTPVLEIVLFLSATFLLGLALGWVLWSFSAKLEISSMASERDFWKKSYDQERLKSDKNQDFEEAKAQRTTSQSRTRHVRNRSSRAS